MASGVQAPDLQHDAAIDTQLHTSQCASITCRAASATVAAGLPGEVPGPYIRAAIYAPSIKSSKALASASGWRAPASLARCVNHAQTDCLCPAPPDVPHSPTQDTPR